MSEPPAENTMVAALLRERAGYLRRGMTDRAAQVDEQLAHHGHTPEPDEPQGRTATPPQQTADQGGKPPAKKTAAKKPPAAPAVTESPATAPAETPTAPTTE